MGKYRIRPGRLITGLVVIFCLAGFLAWGLWSAAAWAKTAVITRLLDVSFIARDEFVETITAQCLLIKREELVKSPGAGKLELLARDGERLKAGTPLAKITGVENKTVASTIAGVFCTHVDGLENFLTPDKLGELDLDAIENIKKVEPPENDEVYRGQYIGKVVDNLHPLYVHVKAENPGRETRRFFNTGSGIALLYQGRELAGEIKQVYTNAGNIEIIAELEGYPDELVHRRKAEMKIVTRRLSGWLVPCRALVFKDGEPGLYIVSEKMVQWVPVFVKSRLDDTVAVESDILNDAVRYITNPQLAREGMFLGSGR